MELTTHTAKGVDKTARYGWVTKDEPGELKMLHKDVLQIHPAYQRDVLPEKVKAITAAWSWLSLGALVVGERGGEFWVIDGQHRTLAAKRRSDITHLPCVVFKTADVKTEARGFLDLNTGRKPVTAVAKQKAMVAAGDEVAAYVQQQCEALGLEIKPSAHTAGQLKCVAWCTRRAAEDKDVFRLVLAMGAELSTQDQMPVAERVLEGLWILHAKCGEDIAVGETYVRWRCYDGGDASTNKMHPECLAMHQAEATRYGDHEWEYSPYSHERPKVEA